MKRIGAAMAIGAAVLMTGCGDPATAHQVVTGQLVRVGGPAPGLPVPLPGQIEARDANGNVFSATAGHDGRFHLSLPLGTYLITGHSPRIQDGKAQCAAAKPVHVTKAGAVAGVQVVCSIR
jgi:hypothetical protein